MTNSNEKNHFQISNFLKKLTNLLVAPEVISANNIEIGNKNNHLIKSKNLFFLFIFN